MKEFIIIILISGFMLAGHCFAGSIVDQQLAASADDADEAGNGAVDIDAAFVDLFAGDHWGAYRWQLTGINSGDIITACTLSFRFYGGTVPPSDEDSAELNIYAEDIGNAPAFVEEDNNISDRARTTAYVFWDEDDFCEEDVKCRYDSPDISDVVQEVIDRSDWDSGNYLAIILDGAGESGTIPAFGSYSYDYSGGYFATYITIYWTPGSADVMELPHYERFKTSFYPWRFQRDAQWGVTEIYHNKKGVMEVARGGKVKEIYGLEK